MPDLQPPTPVIAVLCSDIHLCLRAPPARAREPDWFAAMARPLDELRRVAHRHNVPIVCAGDIFDHWRSPPELINFAIKHLPKMYAIPGQHDLPLHNYSDIQRSAYWTLVEAGVVCNLDPDAGPWGLPQFVMYPFPWGVPVVPCTGTADRDRIHLAVVHAYIWQDRHGFPGADQGKLVYAYQEKLAGYNAAVFGDNHKGFQARFTSDADVTCTVHNCGGFMRRKSDEVGYTPSVGLLMADGTIKRHFLNTDKDVLDVTPASRPLPEVAGLEGFIHELNELGEAGLDYEEAIRRAAADQANTRTREILLRSIEASV